MSLTLSVCSAGTATLRLSSGLRLYGTQRHQQQQEQNILRTPYNLQCHLLFTFKVFLEVNYFLLRRFNIRKRSPLIFYLLCKHVYEFMIKSCMTVAKQRTEYNLR